LSFWNDFCEGMNRYPVPSARIPKLIGHRRKPKCWLAVIKPACVPLRYWLTSWRCFPV
jgi:hypothetical protein